MSEYSYVVHLLPTGEDTRALCGLDYTKALDLHADTIEGLKSNPIMEEGDERLCKNCARHPKYVMLVLGALD